MFSNSCEQSIKFSERNDLSSFLDKIVDDVEDFRCDCKISESCLICETKKWMQMLQQYNGMLSSQQLPIFPEDNYNIPLYLSRVYEIIHAVFSFKSAAMKNLTNHEDEFFKIRSDNESLKVKAKRLQEEIDQKVKQIGQIENQMVLSNKQNKISIEKLQVEKEELNQKIIKIQNKVQGMQNEFKKKELEFLKMKDLLRSKDRINYANRFDTMPLKTQMQNANGFDNWMATRKGLIDEVCQLQDNYSALIQILNCFFQSISNTIELMNPDVMRIPNHSGKIINWLKSSLQKVNTQFTFDDQILKELPQMTSSFVYTEPSQPISANKSQQLNVSHQKNNSLLNSGKKEKDNFRMVNRSQTLHFQQNQTLPDETMSILSRISIRDVPLNESTSSAQFVTKPPQDKQQLKKWEFVFKQQ